MHDEILERDRTYNDVVLTAINEADLYHARHDRYIISKLDRWIVDYCELNAIDRNRAIGEILQHWFTE